MFIKIKILLLLSGAALLSVSSAAANLQKNTTDSPKQAITIFSEEFPPYNYTSKGNITGINIELVKAACKLGNIDCTFKMFPWNRSYRTARTTPYSGLVSTARTPARESLFKWVGPLISGHNCIFKLRTRTDIVFDNTRPITTYTISAASDSAYTQIFAKMGFIEGHNFNVYNGKYGDMKPFVAGRVDLMVGSSTSLMSKLAQSSITINDIVPVTSIDPNMLNGNYLALHKETDDIIVQRLQQSLTQVLDEGYATTLLQEFAQPITLEHKPNETIQNKALWRRCLAQAY